MKKSQEILIVEDNPDNSLLAEKILNYYHYQTKVVSNGKEALEYCEKTLPMLIFMDLSLPDMDGFEVTRLLRKQPEMAYVPIVALSAHAAKEMEELGKKAGLDGFLAKPFLPLQLIEKVKEFLEGKTS